MAWQHLLDHLAHIAAGVTLDALRASDDGGASREMRAGALGHLAERLRWHGKQHDLRLGRGGEIIGRRHAWNERDAGQPARVDAGRRHLGDVAGLATPKRRLGARPGCEVGQRRAPGAGSENRDAAHGRTPAKSGGW